MYSIQHSDRNISPRDYDRFAPGTLLVTSIFFTVQGEGPCAGQPATFVRLAGCDRGDKSTMGCEFCDTKFHFDGGKLMTYDEIIAEMKVQVRRYAAPSAFSVDSPLVVITGGEPMLQNNVTGFIEELLFRQYQVQIESNGDRLPHRYSMACSDVNCTLVVSPKVVKGVYQPLKIGVEPHIDYLKFVVDARRMSPYHILPDWVSTWDPYKVFVSPLTVYTRPVGDKEVPCFFTPGLVDTEQCRKNHAYAAFLAMSHGYRTSIQSHLLMGIE